MNIIKIFFPDYKTKAEVLKENAELKRKLKVQETKTLQSRQPVRECEVFYDVERSNFLNEDFARMHLFKKIGCALQNEFPVKREIISDNVARYSVKISYVYGINKNI